MFLLEKVRSKYSDLKGELIVVDMEKGSNGLGLSLAGHRDRSKLSVFIVGLQPETSASAASDLIHIGDELLEVCQNGIVHGFVCYVRFYCFRLMEWYCTVEVILMHRPLSVACLVLK